MPEQVVQGALENLRLRLDVPSLVGRKPRSLRAEHISSSHTATRRSLPQISNRKWYRANPRPSSRSRGRTSIGRFANHPYTVSSWTGSVVTRWGCRVSRSCGRCPYPLRRGYRRCLADFSFDGGDAAGAVYDHGGAGDPTLPHGPRKWTSSPMVAVLRLTSAATESPMALW